MMRPSRDKYFIDMARLVSTRGTCDRRRVGCVIVSTMGHVLSTGYNGSAPGALHCDDAGHLMLKDRCIRTIHAEANAIAHAARNGTPLSASRAYCTTHPCPACLLLLAAAGVFEVVYDEPYHATEDDVSLQLGVQVTLRQFMGP